MADKKISQLPVATTPLVGTEVLPIVQSGATKQVSVANLTVGRTISAIQLTATNAVQINKTGSDTPWAGPHFTLDNAAAGASERVWADQLNASNNKDTWYYDGSNWNKHFTEDSSGNLTNWHGNLVIGTSGKGIDFSATASGSGTMTSELLSDYEEGTWTPSDASGAGLTIAITAGTTPTYTKIGRLVVCSADITYPVTADATIAKLSMPYTPSSTNPVGSGMIGFKNNGIFHVSSVGTTGANFLNPVNTFLTNANLSGVRFNMTWTYYV